MTFYCFGPAPQMRQTARLLCDAFCLHRTDQFLDSNAHACLEPDMNASSTPALQAVAQNAASADKPKRIEVPGRVNQSMRLTLTVSRL